MVNWSEQLRVWQHFYLPPFPLEKGHFRGEKGYRSDTFVLLWKYWKFLGQGWKVHGWNVPSTILKTKGSLKKTKIGENGEEIEIDSDGDAEDGGKEGGKKGKGKWGFKGMKTTLAGMIPHLEGMIFFVLFRLCCRLHHHCFFESISLWLKSTLTD